jgi:hypothetical protein
MLKGEKQIFPVSFEASREYRSTSKRYLYSASPSIFISLLSQANAPVTAIIVRNNTEIEKTADLYFNIIDHRPFPVWVSCPYPDSPI